MSQHDRLADGLTGPVAAKRAAIAAPLDDSQFEYFASLAKSVTGIELIASKRPMVYARLSRRLLELGIADFNSYIEMLRSGDPDEMEVFINRVTTNLTYFYREPNHFLFLRETALPALLAEADDDKPLRIWSAGCSTGQEPYSLAITLASLLKPLPVPPRILCTDLNTEVLETARKGCFSKEELRGLPEDQRRRWFATVGDGMYQADESLRQLMLFRHLNLFDQWPIRPRVDIIFCRNVMIYFTREAQAALLHRFADLLKVGGYLFLGHSESLPFVSERFERAGTTVYVRTN